ncbi:MAG: hypothetical protein ACK5QT_10520 [Oligoflexia bacterium]
MAGLSAGLKAHPKLNTKRRNPSRLLWGVCFFLSFLTSCTRCGPTHSDPRGANGRGSTSFTVGKALFSFKYPEVNELSISSQDPSTGSRFSAHFRRQNEKWLIQSGPEGSELLDRNANTSFINHLLDTLSTLRMSKPVEAENLPRAEFLSRLGLTPPSHWLRWGTANQSFELQLGSRADAFGSHASAQGQTFLVEGAALKMLEYVTDFRKLRHSKLMLKTIDEVDRVEIRWQTSPPQLLRAERDSGHWVGRLPRRVAPGVLAPKIQSAIESLPQLEIAEFDLPASAFKKAWLSISWMDRHDAQVLIEIDTDLLARASDRPGSTFRLHESARALLVAARFGG